MLILLVTSMLLLYNIRLLMLKKLLEVEEEVEEEMEVKVEVMVEVGRLPRLPSS